MIRDYHMHPNLLNCDESRLDAFLLTAIARGVEEVCFTDHMPLLGNSASDRIPTGRVADYARAVRSVARRYADRISVRLGIEIDYHPSVTDEIEAVLREAQFDFVLGSSHLHVIGGVGAIPRAAGTRNAYADLMLENTLLAARSGYFDAISHLDMYRYVFGLPEKYPLADDGYADELHTARIDRALCAIRDEGLRLEINSHLYAKSDDLSQTYPSEAIVRRALALGLRFCYGSDAHRPPHVAKHLADLRAHPIYGQAIADWESAD